MEKELTKDDFLKVFEENKLESKIIYGKGDVVVVQIGNYEEMAFLFGGKHPVLKALWAICREKSWWDEYIAKPKRVQYVAIDFSMSDNDIRKAFAFTYDTENDKYTNGADRENRYSTSDEGIRAILKFMYFIDNDF